MDILHVEKSHELRTALLVDDDIMVESIWRSIALKLDFPLHLDFVSTFKDATHAIWEKSKFGKPYDIVITDIFLSAGQTGIDLWKTCALDAGTFFFCSGISDAKIKKYLKDYAVHPLLIRKPLDPNICIQILNSVNLQDTEVA